MGEKPMESRSVEKIAEGIRSWGYREYKFSLQSAGDWTSKDAEWNYLDVPHLNEVHSKATAETLFYADQSTSAVLQQKIGPFKLAAILTIYVRTPESLAYASAVGPILMLVESHWGNEKAGPTRVTTTYRLYARWMFSWTLPIVKRLLSRNYEILMSEDLPLRERKGQLRKAGVSFVHDEIPHSFLDSRKLTKNNVILATGSANYWEVSAQELARLGELLLGDSMGQGVRLLVEGDDVLFLPRICLHEGACLDTINVEKRALRCPWHGRKERAWGSISLTAPDSIYGIGALDVEVRGDRILIRTAGKSE